MLHSLPVRQNSQRGRRVCWKSQTCRSQMHTTPHGGCDGLTGASAASLLRQILQTHQEMDLTVLSPQARVAPTEETLVAPMNGVRQTLWPPRSQPQLGQPQLAWSLHRC